MSESSLEGTQVPAPSSGESSLSAWSRRAQTVIRRHPWWIVAVALVVVSYVLVRLAHTRPSYDAYGWLVWGYQTLHLTLDLGGAPSWKPLPFLFTVPFSLFGNHGLTLWMVFSTAVALSGSVFAGKIAYRLTAGERAGRPAAVIAGALAGLSVLGIDQYGHYILTAQSDPMIVALCLGAIDCHLSRRPRVAFVFLVLASLGRPEAWPFAGLYALWAWRAVPSMRILLIAGVAVIPAFWFGVPTITNGRPFVSAQLAEFSVHRIVGSKFVGTFDRYRGLTIAPVQVLAVLATILAILRRNRTVIVLAAGAVLWVIVELAFALHGWPALPRYMFESGAVQSVLAGVGAGWIAGIVAGWIADGVPRLRIPASGRPFAGWAGVFVVLAISAALVPGALGRARAERQDLKRERLRATEISRLQQAITAVGGYRHVRHCGKPVTYVGFVSALAYDMKMNVGFVGHRPKKDLQRPVPVILFTQGPDGWTLEPSHLRVHNRLRCSSLEATVIFNSRHPRGVVVMDPTGRVHRRAA